MEETRGGGQPLQLDLKGQGWVVVAMETNMAPLHSVFELGALYLKEEGLVGRPVPGPGAPWWARDSGSNLL